MDLGADIVVYSGTKHIDGQGRSIGGAILSSQQLHEEYIKPFMRHTGPTLSPFNAWILLKGLETLEYRMDQHCHNALKVANYLSQHPKVEKNHLSFSEKPSTVCFGKKTNVKRRLHCNIHY